MAAQLDLDWDVLERVGWVVLAFAAAEVCTEVAKTLREQRHRGREIEAAPSWAPALPPAPQVFLLTSPAPQQLPLRLPAVGR